jgi:hypothetical protein
LRNLLEQARWWRAQLGAKELVAQARRIVGENRYRLAELVLETIGDVVTGVEDAKKGDDVRVLRKAIHALRVVMGEHLSFDGRGMGTAQRERVKAGEAPCGRNPDFGLPESSAVHQGPRRAARGKMEDSPLVSGEKVANRLSVSTGDGGRADGGSCWFCVR